MTGRRRADGGPLEGHKNSLRKLIGSLLLATVPRPRGSAGQHSPVRPSVRSSVGPFVSLSGSQVELPIRQLCKGAAATDRWGNKMGNSQSFAGKLGQWGA